MTKPLQCFINISFTNGIVADVLQVEKVKPIYKKGDSTKIENYVLTFEFSEVLEVTMSKRLLSFVIKSVI